MLSDLSKDSFLRSLYSMKRNAFSLMELIIVMIIIGILIWASRALFVIPNQHILAWEQCIAAVNGEVSRFLYEGITGKGSSDAQKHVLIFESQHPSYWIKFAYDNNNGSVLTYIKEIILDNNMVASNRAGCISNSHWVLLSGGINYWWSLKPLRVTINKNIGINNTQQSLSICPANTGSSYSCFLDAPSIFTGIIEYSVCARYGTTNYWNCKLFFKQLIDTRSQTIKSNRCLSLPSSTNGECQRRSNDEF